MEVIATKDCFYKRGRRKGDRFSMPDNFARQFIAARLVICAPQTAIATYAHRAITETRRVDMQAVRSSPFDHDGDGRDGGRLPHDPPTLAGKNKAALLALAAQEGVFVPSGATNKQIREAIEAARG